MSFEFLITKFVQSCSARTGFTPMHDAFVCSHCCKRSSRSGLCMSSLSPLHRLATQHFDERYKRKQSESFLSQPEHTIWVSRHRTLRTQYLHLGVFLWKQYIILASYKDFCKLQSFCLCTPLLLHCLSFQSRSYWNCHLHKILLTDEVFQWW